MKSSAKLSNEILISMFSLLWLFLLVVLPSFILLVSSFRSSDAFGGLAAGFSLSSYHALLSPTYFHVFLRTLWVSALCTILCIFLGLPVAYCMARAAARYRYLLLFLVILPFWTCLLVKVFAWRSLLHPEGQIAGFLQWLGILSQGTLLLYNPLAVILISVYAFLPLAVLPLYAAAEKFNFELVDAARDLGANNFQAHLLVFVPGISSGIMAAAIMVLLPALGSYLIPDLVAGPGNELLGNKIAQRVFVDRNLPEASASAVLLLLLTVGFALVWRWLQQRGAADAC